MQVEDQTCTFEKLRREFCIRVFCRSPHLCDVISWCKKYAKLLGLTLLQLYSYPSPGVELMGMKLLQAVMFINELGGKTLYPFNL